MASDEGICEPSVKKERLEDDLEMVNYEMPMQIDLPDAADAEIDPLMPLETDQKPPKIALIPPIKSETEVKEEILIEEAELEPPKIGAVISNFEWPKDQIHESYENKKSASIEGPNSCKQEDVPKEASKSENCTIQQVQAIQQPNRQAIQQACEKQKSELISLLRAPPKPGNVSSPAHCPQSKPGGHSVLGPMLESQPKPEVGPAAAAASTSDIITTASICPEKDSLPILEPLSVNQLRATPFLSSFWTSQQKRLILALSKPKPHIDTLKNISPKLFYDEISWLCGCEYTRKFFCWPCLLFCSNTELWSVPATLALEHNKFSQSCESHKSSPAHQAAETKLILQNSTSAPEPARNEPSTYQVLMTDKVQRNRKLLSLLVQTVCYMRKVKKEATIEDFAECFAHIVLSNKELKDTLREFQGNLSTESAVKFALHYAPLVEASIEKFVKSTTAKELKNAQFVTLFMEDTSRIVDRSTVAFVAHFVDEDGDVQQRTIQLTEIGHDRSAEIVFALFQTVVFEFGLRLKVAGFTYSATLIHPNEVTAFNERVEKLCPKARFFHYQGHNLMGMLIGALSHVDKSCWIFFQSLTELQVFFKKHLISIFQHIELSSCQTELPQYDFDHGFVTTLRRHYGSVMETLVSVTRTPEEWDSGVSSQVPIFMSFLKSSTTRFLIVLISQMNLALADVTGVLQGKIDPVVWKMRIRQGIDSLLNLKKFGYVDIYTAASSPTLKEDEAETIYVPQDLSSIFNEVIETAVLFLRRRFDSDDFGYVDLESVAMRYYGRVSLKLDEIEKFRSQIQLLANEPMIKGKSLPEALKFFYDYNLASAVPEYATFLDFAMTIPSSNTSLQQCRAVERLQVYQRNLLGKPSAADLIWMEKELLTNVLRQQKLIDAVIDILATKSNVKGFSYGNVSDHVVID